MPVTNEGTRAVLRLTTAVTCLTAVTLAVAAAAEAPRDDASTNSPATDLARRMVDAYRTVTTYHATWFVTAAAPDGDETRTEVTVAFDRRTGDLLVRRRPLAQRDGLWCAGRGGELLVSDGLHVRTATRPSAFEPWREDALEPGEDVTYWIVRRLIDFEPVDVPLLLGEHPLGGWLLDSAGAIGTLETEGPDSEIGFRMTGRGEGHSVSARLDGDRHLIRAATNDRTQCRFALMSVTVDEPLELSLFDFQAQLTVLDPTTDH
ncbi:MAG: hypothetical protein ACYTGG_00870 [Planctomycetota bacterium]|jgi:hypothetical protein